MARDTLQQIRDAILDRRYTFTEHAYDEMDAVNLDALDVESAILNGDLDQTLTDDPRGVRYVVVGTACDLATPIGVVVRFTTNDQLLILTVYEIK